jgi:hypothetical protein
MGQRPEGIRITLKTQKILLLIRRQLLRKTRFLQPSQLPEEVPDRILPRMPERRISDIMRQAGSRDYRWQLILIKLPKAIASPTAFPSDRPTDDTSKLCVSRLWTNTGPGNGKT